MEPGQYFLLNYQLHDILWVHYLWPEKQVVKDCMIQIQNVKAYFFHSNLIGLMIVIMIVNQCKVICYADTTRLGFITSTELFFCLSAA